MGDVINLNRFRKNRQKTDDERRAAENRVRHGRTKTERQRDRNEKAKAESELDVKRNDEDKLGNSDEEEGRQHDDRSPADHVEEEPEDHTALGVVQAHQVADPLARPQNPIHRALSVGSPFPQFGATIVGLQAGAVPVTARMS